MILCVGQSGTGKSNTLINFLSRKKNSFYEIIVYTGSTTDEPLYDLIRQRIPTTQFYDDIDELPELTSFDDENKKLEKLIIFDDFIGLKKAEQAKISRYLISSRKFGFTVWLMAQEYVSIPKIITRNAMYFILFRLNDTISIRNIIRNHNTGNVPKDTFMRLYQYATSEKLDFFLIDLRNREWALRRNFTEILSV